MTDKEKKWEIWFNGELYKTVSMNSGLTEEQVYSTLVNSSDYNPFILIKESSND